MIATPGRVLDEAARVKKVTTKKAEADAKRELRRCQADIERATRHKKDAENRLAKLRQPSNTKENRR